MHPKIIAITGATSGLGLAAATLLASEGHKIFAIGRNESRISQAQKAIAEHVPQADITFLNADLSSLKNVRALAQALLDRLALNGSPHLDALINNAGTISSWFMLTEDGYELQFMVNHLAPFLLSQLLLPVLMESPAARIITVSSGSHRHTRMHWKDIMFREHYGCLKAYKQSKLANVLFTYEINRRLLPRTSVQAFALDPGLVDTAIGTKGTSPFVQLFWNLRRKGGKTPVDSAKTLVHLIHESFPVVPKSYYWKGDRLIQPSRYARQETHSRKLWKLSERLCGLEY